MAEKEEEYPLGTPQEHALICEKHKLMPIDFICEDCEEFVCTKCVKEDHKDHNWDTITTAATLKSRGLLKTLTKIEEEDIQQIDEKIEKASKQMEENKRRCETEESRIQRQYEAMAEKHDMIRKQQEKALRDKLASKNADLSKFRSSLEEKKKKVLQSVVSLKENSNTMTDIILLKTHRELTKALSYETNDVQTSEFLMRYECGDINEETLKSMMGQNIDYEHNIVKINSFQMGNKPIELLKAIDESTCLLSDDFVNLMHVNKRYSNHVKKGGKIKVNAIMFNANFNDMLLTENSEVYFTDVRNKFISCLSPSGSVSILFSTDPLVPGGICQTKDGGLLVTLTDTETDGYEPNSESRCLVRHVTLTGDVIHEYEYQEDSQTRLFTWPYIVQQNGNTDICVINQTSGCTRDLLILSHAGSLKSVYSGHQQEEKFVPTDLVCDPHCNIIVNEQQSSTIHLLSPEGQFLRYLLTENHLDSPTAISLKHSTLWIGDNNGCIKVFQYKF